MTQSADVLENVADLIPRANHTVCMAATLVYFRELHHNSNVVDEGMLPVLNKIEPPFTEDELHTIGSFFYELWGINQSREERKVCFLCQADLPANPTLLCKCFRACRVGRYLSEITPASIDSLKKKFPHHWKNILVETAECTTHGCPRLSEVKAGVVDAKFARGETQWKTPKFCKECFLAKKPDYEVKTDKPKTHGKPLTASLGQHHHAKGHKHAPKVEAKTEISNSEDAPPSTPPPAMEPTATGNDLHDLRSKVDSTEQEVAEG